MQLTFFSAEGWETWDVDRAPVIPAGMPVLIDDDLIFEDGPGRPRPVLAVNRWLTELPVSGAPSPNSWAYYARVIKAWMEFVAGCGIDVFGSREALKAALGKYAGHRAAGPVKDRFVASTWNQHVSVLGVFYRWAISEGYASAEPFTYRGGLAVFAGTGRPVEVNLARRRMPRPHVSIKYLEPDFAELFCKALAGLTPDGTADAGFHGRELARNAAVAQLALATGLRLQEFSYLLVWEIPALPAQRTAAPIPFPVPEGVTKGRKARTTWVSWEALAAVHDYLQLDRPATVDGVAWRPPGRWGEVLQVTDPGGRGGLVNGVRQRWETLTPSERRRLVAPGGASAVLAVKSGGGPFTAWASLFERTSDRIRMRFEPRFPHVNPHRTRHTFAMRTLEFLVSGYYRQAAHLAAGTGTDAALALYLSQADPMLVLRDLLGHSGAPTTEKYLKRLDTTRIYREAYERAGEAAGLLATAAEREAEAEFGGDGGER